MVDYVAILDAFGVVGGDWREFRGGEEAGDAAAVAGGYGGTGVGLATGAGGLVELGTVDFGRAEGGGESGGRGRSGAEGEGVEFGLGEC